MYISICMYICIYEGCPLCAEPSKVKHIMLRSPSLLDFLREYFRKTDTNKM